MSIPEFLAKIFGATERIEAALAAKTSAETKLATAEARIAELEGQQSAPTHTAEQIAELEKRPTQEAFDAEKLRADSAEQALQAEQAAHKATKDGEPERTNAAIAAELAKFGHKPVDTTLKKDDDPAKAKTEGLTGKAKVAASIAAQLSK